MAGELLELSVEPMGKAVIDLRDRLGLRIVLPARRRVSPNVALEFGVRYSDRGPTLASPNFHFHQRQLYAFFTIAATTLPTRRAIATTP